MLTSEIKSDLIARASWRDANGGELIIQFAKGKSFLYKTVTQATYHDLLSAESAGKFFHQNIKGRYPYEEAPVTLGEDSSTVSA